MKFSWKTHENLIQTYTNPSQVGCGIAFGFDTMHSNYTEHYETWEYITGTLFVLHWTILFRIPIKRIVANTDCNR